MSLHQPVDPLKDKQEVYFPEGSLPPAAIPPLRSVQLLLESGCPAEDVFSRLQENLSRQHPVSVKHTYLIPLLLKAEDRLDYARSLVTLGLNKEALDPHFKGALYRSLTVLTEEERKILATQLLKKSEEPGAPIAVNSLLGHVMGAMQKTSELTTFIKENGYGRLMQVDSRDVRELCGFYLCRSVVSALEFPARLSSSCWSRFLVGRSLRRLKNDLLELQDELLERKTIASTSSFNNYLRLIDRNCDAIDRLVGNPFSRKKMIDGANALLKKLSIELTYGLSLENEVGTPAWSERELSVVSSLLKKLPPLGIVSTPGLFEIRKMAEIDDGDTLGARYGDGPIEISMDALQNQYVRSEYAGVNSLAMVLCHELGHAFKFGRWGDKAIVGSQEELEGEAHARYGFAEYIAISGWQVIPRYRYELIHADFAVRLDETTEVPLNYPVHFEGKQVIFVYDEDSSTLFSYRADAAFSLHDYGRTSPYEDWAEAFSEYVLLPRRLVAYSPEKFAFFESCFGCHRHNESLQAEWRRRLQLSIFPDGIEVLPDA